MPHRGAASPRLEPLENRALLALVQTIDAPGDVGQYTSIALNPRTGHPAIAYYDVTNKDLKFAAFDGTGWAVTTVDSDGDVGQHASLAFDGRGVPHVAYYDATNNDLRHATKPGASWRRRTVVSALDNGRFSALALTRAGLPRIAFRGEADATHGGVRFASFNGSAWVVEEVHLIELSNEEPVGPGGDADLALDSHDRPHVSYNNFGLLEYATLDGLEWKHLTIAGTFIDDFGHNTSIVVDARDRPHVSYANLPVRPQETAYTFLDETGWHGRRIDFSSASFDSSGATSIAIDSRGLVRVAFRDNNGREVGLGIASYDGRAFHVANPDARAGDQYVSMAMGPGDVMHVASYKSGDLTYFRSDPGTGPAPVKSFDRASYEDFAIAADGTQHVAYYGKVFSGNSRLRYASRPPGGAWSDTVVVDEDPARDTGQFVSMALDSIGGPGLAYYDATNGDLKYAKLVAGAWQVQTVDSRGTVGQYPSLAFDSADRPIVSYYYKTNGDLRLAHFKNGAWSMQTVDAVGDTGRSSDLVFDPANRVWTVAYEKTSTGEFRFARAARGGGAWGIVNVDDTQTGGGYVSLAYDAQRRAAFTYYDSFFADLKFARFENGQWRTGVVASRHAQGAYSKLFFEPGSDVARVLYQHRDNSANRQLDMAVGDFGAWTLTKLRDRGGQHIATARDPVTGARYFAWEDDGDILIIERLS